MPSRTPSSRPPFTALSSRAPLIYCTHTPCILCAKMLTNAKIKRYVSYGKYADEAFMPLFEQAGIRFEQTGRVLEYDIFLD